ncbi:ubiquinol-cytochrome c reductase iron-sulfur subunit [Temperatibacter marinus]|uniref:Ubiquinol-cytochrome c reductase iron-sulfur subunit n=1 Tax=Temperatibacter marinus TaxID=1456591 RepID=A0AA52H9E8_9PROT|nr:ubiquinol-cytochrome c reductase iron-sulfur subunit [Temperatibacter marinus]WND01610.1 ubiquinol-cytochrome c reductase iron-sulfur subunit [Temperatibacter marinus]
MSTNENSNAHGDGATRRDFLHVATAGVGAVGAAAAVWPFIDQMNPAKDTLAAGSVELDLSAIGEGESVVIKWRGKPVFVRHRTAAEIAQAKADDKAVLVDPETDEARITAGREKWLVVMGVCTHLGCVPLGSRSGDDKGEFGGWYCPCHGSHYDTSGRIRKGPAPTNLEVPGAITFLSDTKIKIG